MSGAAVTTTVARPRVLIVDDAAYNREVLVQNLEDEYEVLQATDGVAAVVLARTRQPDLILLDLSLPVLDGWEAARLQPKLDAAGVLCFDEGGRIRWVTHYGIERSDIDEALARTRAVLAAGA